MRTYGAQVYEGTHAISYDKAEAKILKTLSSVSGANVPSALRVRIAVTTSNLGSVSGIRQHTSAYVSIRIRICQHMRMRMLRIAVTSCNLGSVSGTRQHTSAYAYTYADVC